MSAMKFAGRMNSFIFKGDYDLLTTIQKYRSMDEITHLEFNYPEHFAQYSIEEIKEAVGDMPVNGVATRFKEPFIKGEFTNVDENVRRKAIDLCKGAVDACRAVGGKVVTVWQAYDGFDYPFQVDYEKAWNRMIEAFREVADYAQDILVSIEYKPYEPRNYAMLDSIGTTLLAIEEINRPNMGITLDFCHMQMKHDCPAYALALAAKSNKLFGLHMNDGYRLMDSGLIFGSVNLSQCIEFVYYLKKYSYDGVVFFDTFPVREETEPEICANIRTFQKINDLIDRVGMDEFDKIISKNDGVASQQFLVDILGL
ncbi:MAG: sugar phosphate isomerase/epimerase [Lachnospiraceae bacterium]|nr:sugar phosphate isomerase/epimerase [Lachnospiraceae bacterium]